MSAPALEAFLARLFADEPFREDFIARPEAVARVAELDEAEVASVIALDRVGLALAAESYRHKRK